jgi:ferric enterobactin receptor
VNRCFLIVLLFSSTVSLAQQLNDEVRVNEIFHRVPLSKALKKIQSNYHIKIAYDNALIRNIIVDIVLSDVSLSESFERLLLHTPLDFNKVGDNVVIVPKPPVLNTTLPLRHDLKIAGKILDEHTAETLPNAIIKVSGTDLIASSNNDGYYAILHVPSDTATIDISCMGYITQSIHLSKIDNPLNLNVKLKDDTKILEEVIVTDEYNQSVQVEDIASKVAFNPRSLSNLPSLGEQDISRTMQLMPGVCATDESSSGMSIRGMHPSYNLVLLDGITIYQQDHFFGAYSIVNSDIIKDVRVSKGVFDAKYGGRVSGVVDITTKNGNSLRPAFNVKVNFINVKATAEIPLSKKISIFIAGRRSFTDVIQSNLYKNLFDVAMPSNDQIQIFPLSYAGIRSTKSESPSFYYYDINSKITFKPSERDIFSLSIYNSRDRLLTHDTLLVRNDTINVSGHDSEFTTWGNTGVSLRWGRQWSEKFYSNARLSYSEFYKHFNYERIFKTDTTKDTYGFDSRNSIGDLSFAVDNEWLLHARYSIDFGVSGIHQKTNLAVYDFKLNQGYDLEDGINLTGDDSISVYQTANTFLATAYASFNAKIAGRLNVSLGGRLNYYLYYLMRQEYIEPRVMLQYKVSNRLNLKVAYGRSNQFVNQLIYYGYNGSVSDVGTWLLSKTDYDFPVTLMDQFTTGATYKYHGFVFDAEAYYKINKGIVIDTDVNEGNTIMYGLDLMAQKTTGIHKGWISYSLSKAMQSNPNIQDGKYFPSLQDQRHELKIVNMFMLGNWNLSSTLIYGSGKPYPTYKAYYQKDNNGNIKGYNLVFDYRNQSRVPSYFRLDIAAAYKLKFTERADCEIGLSLFNVTDHRNVKTRKINIDELSRTKTEIQPSYLDVKSMRFVPCLFLSISF